MQQTQVTTRQPCIQTFSEYREFDTSSGSKLYRLTNKQSRDVCRIDERFIPLIEYQLECIQLGEEVDFICIPDKHNANGWRLDLDHYRSCSSNQKPSVPHFAPPENALTCTQDQKNVTFTISKQDHTFITAMHKRLKHTNPLFAKFSDLTSYIFETSVRNLRLQHPELDQNLDDIPF
jgi:hypothetical protein